MISNLADYFDVEQEFYLDKISYKRIGNDGQFGEYFLNCIDNIEAKVNNGTVEVTVERVFEFEPKELFELSVEFGAVLKFNEERKGEYDWESMDLAKEFRENGQFVLGNLMNRISLLMAEITSSSGQVPIILPPMVAS